MGAPSNLSLMLADQTRKTQTPNILNVKFQVYQTFSCVCCCDTVMCAVMEDQSRVHFPSYRMSVFEHRNPLTRVEIPHHTKSSMSPPALLVGLASQTEK